jgi:hypothetical protein
VKVKAREGMLKSSRPVILRDGDWGMSDWHGLQVDGLFLFGEVQRSVDFEDNNRRQEPNRPTALVVHDVYS